MSLTESDNGQPVWSFSDVAASYGLVGMAVSGLCLCGGVSDLANHRLARLYGVAAPPWVFWSLLWAVCCGLSAVVPWAVFQFPSALRNYRLGRLAMGAVATLVAKVLGWGAFWALLGLLGDADVVSSDLRSIVMRAKHSLLRLRSGLILAGAFTLFALPPSFLAWRRLESRGLSRARDRDGDEPE